MVTVGHRYPGVTLLNVWDLTLHDWLYYVDAVEAWAEAEAKANK